MFEAASRLGSGSRGASGTAAATAAAGGAAGAAGGEDDGHLQFLRNNPQFQQLRQLVQQQPQMLQSILEQLNQANPQLARDIVDHPEEFMELLAGDEESDAPVPPGATSVPVTPEERDAIERVCCTFS
jgi:UV excision repair protein RAD23